MPVNIPGIENLSPALKYAIAFIIIFALLALFALILRRLTGGRLSLSNERGRARQPRLGIVDVYDLDRQRQLILLRRDNVEHLLLVGGPNDVVVETNIVRVPGARLPTAVSDAADRLDSAPDRPVEIAPMRPVVEAGSGRLGERGFEPVVAAHLGASDGLSGKSGQEGALKPTSVSAAPPAPTPPPAPRPAPPRPVPIGPEPRAGSGRPGSTPSGAPNGSGAQSGAPIMADMTTQLEAALRRPPQAPAEPARPAPPPIAPPRPRPPEPAPKPQPSPGRDEPIAAKPAPAPARPAPPPPPRPAPTPSAPPPPAPAPAPAQAGSPQAASPQAGSPSPQPPPPPPPPKPASPPTASLPAPATASQPSPASAPKPDPFSIEDIEAEFARLLGRPLDAKKE